MENTGTKIQDDDGKRRAWTRATNQINGLENFCSR